jgi:eukaryotic-like serine/threonine-protein kinase
VVREEIRECLWGENINVDFDRGINFCINQIRDTLDDHTEKPRYIETLQRRGYRFIAPVEFCTIEESSKRLTAIPVPQLPTGDNGNVTGSRTSHIDPLAKSGTSKFELSSVRVSLGVAILLATGVGLFLNFSRRNNPPTPKLTLLQLTANSAENPVESGAISPDGKYLAYADLEGMHIKMIRTGETRTVSQPKSITALPPPYWEIVQWFPDGIGFLANMTLSPELSSSEQQPSIWSVELLGGDPRKLQDNAEAWSISPDGSLISFSRSKGRFGYREIWLMGPNGENPRKLVDLNENEGVRRFHWFPGGRRVAYVKSDQAGDTLLSSDLETKSPTILLTAAAMDRVRDFVFLPDGHMLYSAQDPAGTNTCNYWKLQIDLHSGEAVAEPNQLTYWAGFCELNSTVTENGKQLAFIETVGHASTYLADLEANGTRIARTRKFTLNESWDFPVDWMADSKTLLLLSNRNGRAELFKQTLNETGAEPLRIGPEDVDFAHVTPDGHWLLYTLEGHPGNGTGSRIIRAPVEGGSSQSVANTRKNSQILCPRAPATFCVLGEPTEQRDQFVFTTFDPLKGPGIELARIPLQAKAGNYLAWDVSPDGTRFAVHDLPEGPYHILSLHGAELTKVQPRGWSTLRSCDWSADGKGLFISAPTVRGSALLHLDLQGRTHVLWEQPVGKVTYARPSPDGRHIAMVGWIFHSNVWMMENF